MKKHDQPEGHFPEDLEPFFEAFRDTLRKLQEEATEPATWYPKTPGHPDHDNPLCPYCRRGRVQEVEPQENVFHKLHCKGCDKRFSWDEANGRLYPDD